MKIQFKSWWGTIVIQSKKMRSVAGTPLLAALAALTFVTTSAANTFTQSKSASTPTISQDGHYCLWGYGNYHGWCVKPSPASGDGYIYTEWSLQFDISAARGKVTYAGLNASWTINAPIIYPVVWTLIPWWVQTTRQPIKQMNPAAAGWLTRLVFSDGYTYWFSGPPRQNPNSLDLVALGLVQHLQNSTQVTLVGTLQYNLGRAYLDDASGDDWQHAHGWAERCDNHANGTASATGSGTLTIDFTPPGTNPGAPPLSSSPVAYLLNMKSYYQFCSAEGGGGQAVNCNRAIPASTWELFTITDLDGGAQLLSGHRVTIQASNSQYCSAAPATRWQAATIVCNKRAASTYEVFSVMKMGSGDKVIRNGDAVAFLNANGYVTAQMGGSHPLYPTGSLACSRWCYGPSAWSVFSIQNLRARSLVAHTAYTPLAMLDDDILKTGNEFSTLSSATEVSAYLTRLLPSQNFPSVIEYRFADMQADGRQQLIALAELQDAGRVLVVVGDTADGPLPSVFAIPSGSQARLSDIVRDLHNDGIPELVLEEPPDNYIPALNSPDMVVQQVPPPFWVNILKWTVDGTKDVSDQFPEFYRDSYLPSIERTLSLLREKPGGSDGEKLAVPYEVLSFKCRRLLGDQSAGLPEAVSWAYSGDIQLQARALEVLDGLPVDYPTVRPALKSLL